MCRTLYDAKTASIGFITSTAVQETRVLNRGMRQTGVPMEKGASDDGNQTDKEVSTIKDRGHC